MQSPTVGQERIVDRPRFCPQCGSATTAMGLRCTVCGLMFADIQPIANFWDRPNLPIRRAANDGHFVDPYQSAIEPDEEGDPDTASLATVPYAPVVDPWSSMGGRLGAAPGSPQAFVPPAQNLARPGESGPPAWLLGALGIALILGVAAAALLLVVRPLVSDRIESVTGDAIATALSQTTIERQAGAGTMVISEQQINRSIRANRATYQPVEDLRVQIRRSGIQVTFSVYGTSATLTGTVKVRNGRIVIVNPVLTGSAGRIVSVDRIAADAERAINDYLKRNNLKPTAVTLADDTLTITTASIG